MTSSNPLFPGRTKRQWQQILIVIGLFCCLLTVLSTVPSALVVVDRAASQEEQKRRWEYLPHQLEAARQRRPLNMFHIPKTGGTSLIAAAIRANLTWADCLFRQHSPGKPYGKCHSPAPQGDWPTSELLEEEDADEHTYRYIRKTWMHVPIQHLPLQRLNKTNPYEPYDLFAVVRNPYERAISNYFYLCQLPSRKHHMMYPCNDSSSSATYLNAEIQRALQTILSAEPNTTNYYLAMGHWIPQYDFVYFDDNNSNSKRRRMIQHVLHLEQLKNDLPQLLKAYNLQDMVHYYLKSATVENRRPSKYQHISVHNLTNATLRLIETVYEKDFQLGRGYPKISTTSPSS